MSFWVSDVSIPTAFVPFVVFLHLDQLPSFFYLGQCKTAFECVERKGLVETAGFTLLKTVSHLHLFVPFDEVRPLCVFTTFLVYYYYSTRLWV